MNSPQRTQNAEILKCSYKSTLTPLLKGDRGRFKIILEIYFYDG
jgi:hypothetical protein